MEQKGNTVLENSSLITTAFLGSVVSAGFTLDLNIMCLPPAVLIMSELFDAFGSLLLKKKGSFSQRDVVVVSTWKRFLANTMGGTLAAYIIPTSSRITLSLFSRTLLLRFFSGFRNYLILNKHTHGVDLLTQVAISTVFFGIVTAPTMVPSFIVKMTRSFVGAEYLDRLRGKESKTEDKQIMQYSTKTFIRTFRDLLIYNILMHLASLSISTAIRKKKPPQFSSVLNSIREALTLNLAVATSCTLFVLSGSVMLKVPRLHNNLVALTAASTVPLPLAFISNDSVKQSIFFLFVPWTIKFIANALENKQTNTADDQENNSQITKKRNNNTFLGAFVFGLCFASAAQMHLYASNSWAIPILFSSAQQQLTKLAGGRFNK